MSRIRILLPVVLLLAAAVALAAAGVMSVQVRTGKMRAKPSFLGPVVASVGYGDRVTVLGEKGGWVQIRNASGKTGWIHVSALTEKKVVLRAGDADVATGASGEELALAGKGFNDAVEAEFRAENPNADYTWVDKMETFRVTPEQARDFLAAGKVTVPGGER